MSRSDSVKEARTSDASVKVVPSFATSADVGVNCRSENSAGRLRASFNCLNDETSHCRTLPLRCSIRLPMLLLASFGRHHTCSSLNDSTQLRRRGQYCSSSFQRENSRKRWVTLGSTVIVIEPSARRGEE